MEGVAEGEEHLESVELHQSESAAVDSERGENVADESSAGKPSTSATAGSTVGGSGVGLSFMWQQLLEELGRAKSTESEANAKVQAELVRIRAEVQAVQDAVGKLRSTYSSLRTSMGAFGQKLYELGIRETDSVRTALMDSGVLGRSMAPPMESLIDTELAKLEEALAVQVKAIQDARETKESYRQSRLAYDGAARAMIEATKSAKGVEAAEAAEAAALARYQKLAEALKTKVMLLHQYRIRSLHAQLKSLKSLFFNYFTECTGKLPLEQTAPDRLQEGAQTKELSQLLDAQSNQ